MVPECVVIHTRNRTNNPVTSTPTEDYFVEEKKVARSKNVDSWIYEFDPKLREIMFALRDLILDTDPELKESIRWGNPIYQKNGSVCYLSCDDRYVTLGFFDGVFLEDDYGRFEGTGRKMRHIKLKDLKDMDDIITWQVVVWVKESVDLNRLGDINKSSNL